VQKFSPTGELLARWGGPGTDPGFFHTAFGICVDPYSNVFVVDHHNFRVQKFDNDGNWLAMWGTKGTDAYQFASSHGMACDARGQIYIIDFQGTGYCCYVQKYAYPQVGANATRWSDVKSLYRP